MKTALLIGTVAASLLTTLALGSALANPNGTARVQVFLARSDPGIRCDKVYPVSRRVRTPAVLRGAVEAHPERIEFLRELVAARPARSHS